MATLTHLWLKDDNSADIKSSVDIHCCEGSIEITGLSHGVIQPADRHNGKAASFRVHSPYSFDREIGPSSPYLYKAVSSGQELKSTEVKFYCINNAGQEAEYFSTLTEGMTIVSIYPMMLDIRDPCCEKYNHTELVELLYEKITWRYTDDSITHSDSRNGRATV